MALISFQQTDTAADNGFTVGGSGLTAGSTTISREMTEGGTAGSSEFTVDPGVNQAERACISFQTDVAEPSNVYWGGGSWTVRLNVTTSNMDMQWRGTYIYERTTGGTFIELGTLTAQTTSLGSTGTATHTVTQSRMHKPAASSTIVIVIGLYFNNTHGGTTVGITPSLTHSSPMGVPVTVAASGGDYTTLEAAIEAGTPERYIDITGTWAADNDVTGAGNTITVNNQTVIVCDSSSRNPGYPHTGTGSWFRLRKTGTGHIFTLSADVAMVGLEMQHEAAAASDENMRCTTGWGRGYFDSCGFGYSARVGSGQSDILITDHSSSFEVFATNCFTYNADRAVWSFDSATGACTAEVNSCSSYDCGPGGTIDRWEAYVGIVNGAAHVVRIFNSAIYHEGTSGALVQAGTVSSGESVAIDRSITNLADWANTWATETITDSLLSRTWTDNASPGTGDWVVIEDLTSTIPDIRNKSSAENDAQDAHADASGAGLTMPSTDVTGSTSRPVNTNYDIGHYEIPAASVTVTPGTATLTLTPFAPTVSTPVVVTPGTASLTLAPQTPTVSTPVVATPGTASLTLTPFVPTVSTPVTVTPGASGLTLTPLAPTVSTPVVATPGVASLTLTPFAPTVTAGGSVTVTPGTASLALTPFAPTVSTPVMVTPTTLAVETAGHEPTVTASDHQTVTPPTLALTTATFAPTVTTTDHQTVTPPTAALTTTTFEPTVTASGGVTVTPTTASLATTTFEPTVTPTEHVTVTPTTLPLTLTTYEPTVSTGNIGVIPTTASLVLTGFEPTISHTIVVPLAEGTIDGISLSLTTFAPTVTTTPTSAVTTATYWSDDFVLEPGDEWFVEVSGPSCTNPTVRLNLDFLTFPSFATTPENVELEVPTAVLATGGWPPVLGLGIIPGTAALTLSTFTPTVSVSA